MTITQDNCFCIVLPYSKKKSKCAIDDSYSLQRSSLFKKVTVTKIKDQRSKVYNDAAERQSNLM
jgi:hypothetical protein